MGNDPSDYESQRKKWYKKLEKSGFEDIEDKSGNLKQYDRRTIAFDNREKIQAFFLKLDSYLTNTKDIPPKHRKVLELYSAGVHVKGKHGIAKRTRVPVRTINSWLKKYKEIINNLQ